MKWKLEWTEMMNTEDKNKALQGKNGDSQLVLSIIKNGLFLQRELGQVCQQFALNTNQFVVINEIILRGPVSQKELCSMLLFEKSNISKIVKTLQDKALISVSVAPVDRRSTLLIETQKGLETWRDCLQPINNSCIELMSLLSDDEILSMLKQLKKFKKA